MKSTGFKARYLLLTVLSTLFFTAACCLPLAFAATRSGVMEKAFYTYANTSVSGVKQASYRALSEGITGYLAEKKETAQVIVDRFGSPGDAFSQKELEHLKDVRALVTTAVRVSWLLGASLAVAAILLAFLYSGKRKRPDSRMAITRVCKSIIAGFILLIVAASAVVIWAAVDFNGLFILFHQLSFSNDLWMLESTDLLIQLMPLGFFKYYAVRVLLEWLALNLVLLLPAMLYLKMRKKHEL